MCAWFSVGDSKFACFWRSLAHISCENKHFKQYEGAMVDPQKVQDLLGNPRRGNFERAKLSFCVW